MSKYFIVVGLLVPCSFILAKNKRFDLSTGIPNNALEVYKSGFRYLGLKPGAEILFKKSSVGEIIHMIKYTRRIEDVEILSKVREHVKIKEEANKRILELGGKI